MSRQNQSISKKTIQSLNEVSNGNNISININQTFQSQNSLLDQSNFALHTDQSLIQKSVQNQTNEISDILNNNQDQEEHKE